jgi:4-hydroxy-tetrahydrodipicolinate synthase
MKAGETHTAVPTALHDDGSLDAEGQATVAATVAAAGVAGIVALDLAVGEVVDLDLDERDAVVRATRRGAAGVPVAVGLGPTDRHTTLAAHRAAAAGADVLVVTVAGPPARLADTLTPLEAVGLPLWLQHHPGRTATVLSPEELAELATSVGVDAVVVDAAPSPDGVAAVVAARGDAARPAALGGLAGLFLLEELEAGAAGTTAGGAAVERVVEVVSRHHGGTAGDARDGFVELCAYLRLEAGAVGDRVRKEAWRQRGALASARVRRGTPLGTTTRQAITRRLREVGIELREPFPGA